MRERSAECRRISPFTDLAARMPDAARTHPSDSGGFAQESEHVLRAHTIGPPMAMASGQWVQAALTYVYTYRRSPLGLARAKGGSVVVAVELD